MKIWNWFAVTAGLASIAIVANAKTIVDLRGDKDGFDIGAKPDQVFDWEQVPDDDEAEAAGTDGWRRGNHTWSHTYTLAGLGPITAASLEVMTGGQGFGGLSTVLIDLIIDEKWVGTLTDGETDPPGSENYARLDVFDLSPWIPLLDGANTFTVRTFRPGDRWVLDYSQLSVSDEVLGVPDGGGTGALLALALVGLVWIRRSA